jgi:hypothetical protein
MAREGRPTDWDGDFSQLEIVLRIGLACPELLRTQHGEHQLLAVSSFQYFATKTSAANRQNFTPPPAEARAALEKALDGEFAARQRGRNTVRVTPYELDGYHCYVIDHGGTMHRQATTDDGVRGVVHFRPDEHDLVVYNPVRDEVRIHANADWQREAYRTEFGKFLRADYQYFSLRKNFTLEPLRDDVERALSTENFPDIPKVTLVEVGICYDGEFAEAMDESRATKVRAKGMLDEPNDDSNQDH